MRLAKAAVAEAQARARMKNEKANAKENLPEPSAGVRSGAESR